MGKKEVRFARGPATLEKIKRIAERAWRREDLREAYASELDIIMDLAAVHVNNPLRLDDLLNADDLNFTHDLGGNCRHLDRDSGELRDCFTPRFSASALVPS